ncbi:hypothetical protein VCHENC02_1946A, partial [Vibrio harveyi]
MDKQSEKTESKIFIS